MADFYGTWKEDTYVCGKCGWTGTGEQCTQGEMFNDLYEIDCPSCGKRVDVVLYPTIKESRANWEKVSDADKAMIEAREQFIKEAESRCLESPEELPEVKGEVLIFVWDQHKYEKNRDDTVITYGKQVICTEPAFYEGYDRFIEVAEILKKRYGDRFIDLIPAERSGNYLYGDRISAPQIIEEYRDRLSRRESAIEESQSNSEKVSDVGKTVFQTALEQAMRRLASRSAEVKKRIQPREQYLNQTEPQPLKSPEQLPEIEEDEFILVWDEEASQNYRGTVIRYGNEIIWREFSPSSRPDRFEEIAQILGQRYGGRLKDLAPTRRSEINLERDRGDGLSVNKTIGKVWMNQY